MNTRNPFVPMQSPPDISLFAQPQPLLYIEEVDRTALDTIRRLNRTIFEEDRIINSFERDDLMMLMAYLGNEPVGFKIGYRESRHTYYSAKGGVLGVYRRRGISRRLLYEMMDRARARGYKMFAYDTFPNMHPGMTVLGLAEGFRITRADFNPTYKDFRLRFEKAL